MMITNSMFGIAEALIAKQAFEVISEMQDLLFASENHNENLQRAKDDQEFARENQRFSRENHSDNRDFAREDQQFARENHRHNQRVAIENQWFASENQELDLLIKRSNMKTQLALDEQEMETLKAEMKKSKAENTFRWCLVNNRHSSDLGHSGFPKVCEDSAKIFRLLGGGSEVDELTEDFKK